MLMVVFLLVIGPSSSFSAVRAQTPNATATTTNTTVTTTGQLPINLTEYFAQSKGYQSPCAGCGPNVDVLYQSPHTLVLSSTYIDAIWKAVDFAKNYGYKVDGISTYTTTDPVGGTINVLVAMSR